MILIHTYKECFATYLSQLAEPCISEKHIIRTTSEIPIVQMPYRRSKQHDKIIELEVEKMKKYGIIRDSKSPWSSKPVTDKFPMPRIDDILDNLSGSVFFSNIDCKNGYWQQEMHENSIEKTEFTTKRGHFEFVRFPFGLKNGPAIFNRLIRTVLGKLEYVEIYFDDIIIHSKTFEEHLIHLKDIF